MSHHTVFLNPIPMPDCCDYSADFDVLSIDSPITSDFPYHHNISNLDNRTKPILSFHHNRQNMDCAGVSHNPNEHHIDCQRSGYLDNENNLMNSKNDNRQCTYTASEILWLMPSRLRKSIQSLLVPYKFLRLHDLVGKGHFGYVYKGTLKDSQCNFNLPLAVKTLKGWSNITEIENFLRECSIMKRFNHLNVLRIIGISLSPNGDPCMILPFMQLGDLRSYTADPQRTITIMELIYFAVQIADGMAYISELLLVHRDLAARNCMLTENGTVKVADFGLTIDFGQQKSDEHKTLSSKCVLCKNSENSLRLPIKWMAIECLRDRNAFSTKSDVWSFGVVLWELMTRGAFPYVDIHNTEIRSFLESGRRLPQPVYCPDIIYDMMLTCCRPHPCDRPDFVQIALRLRSIMRKEEKRRLHGSRTQSFFNIVPPTNAFTNYFPNDMRL